MRRSLAVPCALICGLASAGLAGEDDGLPVPNFPTGRTGKPLTRPSSGRSAAPETPATGGRLPTTTGRTDAPRGTIGAARAITGETGVVRGVAAVDPPNGRVVGFDLSRVDEDDLLRPDGKAAIVAVADRREDFDATKEPLILVHGIRGEPSNLQPILDRARRWQRYQTYVLCYDDFHRRTSLNGVDLAEELRSLATRLGCGRQITIVGHSLGGIVVRRALNDLSFGTSGGVDRFRKIRFVAVDSPWHGYSGPSDRGIDALAMFFGRIFLPDGLEDMRARSNMFQGEPDATDPAERQGLLAGVLPANVNIDVVVARSGTEVYDWSESELSALPGAIAARFNDDTPVAGDPLLVNFWRGLIQADAFLALSDDLDAAGRVRRLDARFVAERLEARYPRFPGGHTTMLEEHPGERSFLDWLEEKLSPPAATVPR